MRTFAIIAALLVTTVVSRAEKLSFADLKSNETIVIGYRSAGPFHVIERKYVIEGDHRWMKIYERQSHGRDEKEYKGPERLIGEGPLAASEIVGLDSYLKYLRMDWSDHFPTKDEVRLGYYRDEKRIGEERLKDDSGALSEFSYQKGELTGPFVVPLGIAPHVFLSIRPPRIIEQRMLEAKQELERSK